MAKNTKNTVPTINPPNSGLRAWLSQTSPVSGESAADDSEPKAVTTPVQVDNSGPEMSAEKQGVNQSEPEAMASVEEVSQLSKGNVASKGEEVATSQEPVVTKEVAPAPRKPKNRGGEEPKSSSYLETFFKKPVKANGSGLASEGKPIRVSEESHLLLSVLVSEARRQGYKLNVGDLIDNLLAHHRSEHKSEVNELIAKWKTRKSFD